jgi:hypothetical protein
VRAFRTIDAVVAAADTVASRYEPPAPEQCPHPAPVRGVLAHEFDTYAGAVGPEGIRRTITFYGPVIGGLPIEAWHCEVCGLLRLTHADGRTEERRLFPGPQPGLLAAPSAIPWGRVLRGEQPRVSGLSVSDSVYQRMYATEAGTVGAAAWHLQLPRVQLPDLDLLGWANLLGLTAIGLGLLVAALVAVLPESLQPEEAPLVVTLAIIFGVLLVANVVSPFWRRIFPMPRLAPSVAESARGRPSLDLATRWAVSLLVASVIGLFASGVLAVYWFATPGAMAPVLILSLALAVCAALVEIGGAVARAGHRADPNR